MGGTSRLCQMYGPAVRCKTDESCIGRQVDVIAAAGGTPSAVAAKASTATIPIVFAVAVDPVKIGLVTSLNRPGGNLTGITNLNVEVGPKRLELLHELIPTAAIIALLVNRASPSIAEHFSRALKAAASTLRLQLHVLQASTEQDFAIGFRAAPGHKIPQRLAIKAAYAATVGVGLARTRTFCTAPTRNPAWVHEDAAFWARDLAFSRQDGPDSNAEAMAAHLTCVPGTAAAPSRSDGSHARAHKSASMGRPAVSRAQRASSARQPRSKR
jgi:ABC transporter substrate binding protein